MDKYSWYDSMNILLDLLANTADQDIKYKVFDIIDVELKYLTVEDDVNEKTQNLKKRK